MNIIIIIGKSDLCWSCTFRPRTHSIPLGRWVRRSRCVRGMGKGVLNATSGVSARHRPHTLSFVCAGLADRAIKAAKTKNGSAYALTDPRDWPVGHPPQLLQPPEPVFLLNFPPGQFWHDPPLPPPQPLQCMEGKGVDQVC